MRLLGINLSTDELPGSALVDDDKSRATISSSTERVWISGDSDEEICRNREQRNLKRIEQVFTQLSNNSSTFSLQFVNFQQLVFQASFLSI